MKRLPWILLALSVCLNIGFVLGFAQTRAVLKRLDTKAARFDYGLDRLGLEGEARSAAKLLASEWRAAVGTVQREHREEFDRFWRAMVAGEAGGAELEQLAVPLLEAQREATILSIAHLRRLFATLTPEQRTALSELIRRHNAF
jgi:hypothetical protein